MPYLRPNTDAAFGFMPADGTTARIRHYSKASSTPAIFAGDLVVLNSSGQVVSSTANSDIMLGVAVESVASGSTTTCAVYDDPDQLFVCQDDSVGTALAQTHMGNLFQVTGFTPGTAAQVTRNRSIMQLDTSTTATAMTAAGQPLKLIDLHGIEGGSFPSASGSPRKVVVSINPYQHLFASAAGV